MFHVQAIDKFRDKHNDIAYAIFRVIVGLLFAAHGAQKLFGLFTQNAAQQAWTLMWTVGIIEFVGGLLVALGVLTAFSAVVTTVMAALIYLNAHFTFANPNPMLNRGELISVYFAAFLYIAFRGSGKYSLDAVFCKQCRK